MDRETYTNSKVVDLAAKQFIPVKLDLEKPAAVIVAEKYKVEGSPTVLFVHGSGRDLNRFTGFKAPPQFIGEMEDAIKRAKK